MQNNGIIEFTVNGVSLGVAVGSSETDCAVVCSGLARVDGLVPALCVRQRPKDPWAAVTARIVSDTSPLPPSHAAAAVAKRKSPKGLQVT